MQADQQTVDTSFMLSPVERGVWNKCKALQKQENKLKNWEQVIGGWRLATYSVLHWERKVTVLRCAAGSWQAG